MKILLDTCTFLWFITANRSLPKGIKETVINPENEVYLSAISVWEILVKGRLGKLKIAHLSGEWIALQRESHGISPLPLKESSLIYLPKLPDYHRDPFDRLLICQAMEHSLVLVTPDELILQYPVKTRWNQ